MSADTGAREPLDSVSAAENAAREFVARCEGESREATHAWVKQFAGDHSYAHSLADDVWNLIAIVRALAAGVGVPPDKDSVSAPAKERQDARAVGSDPRTVGGVTTVKVCPEPFWHETHRYCPVCPWTENDGSGDRG